MNDKNEFDKNNEIDLVDFSSNSEMQRIRENERIEREKRRKRAAAIRRQEIIRQKKRRRLQQMITAWGLVLLVLAGIVAAVIGIVSLFNKDKKTDVPAVGDTVSEEETKLVEAFTASKDVVYVKEGSNPYLKLANDIVIKAASGDELVSSNGELHMYSDTYAWNSAFGQKEKLKDLVRDTPLLNNYNYVWTTPSSQKSPVTNTYYYDTHASFIKAVCEICLWEGDASFLGEVDERSVDQKDVSAGKSVGQKLNAAVDYFFDTSKDGGIRYNGEDGLVYIRTSGNNGAPGGNASNVFFTYNFGYLDCYNNLLFYDAMVSLSKLYEMTGDDEESQKYIEIANKNKEAINEKFYDGESGRYVGYIDINGNKHDYGFTALNLMAVSLGVADDAKADKIMSWVDGDGRASSGLFPAFTTVEADDSGWSTYGKYLTSQEASYKNFWLNGGRSALSGYCYLEAMSIAGTKETSEYLKKVVKGVEDASLKLPDSENDFSEPGLYYAMYSSDVIKHAFGVSTDGSILTLSPSFERSKNMGIKDISFKRRNYDVLFDSGKVYLFADVKANTKVKIGGFDKDCKLTLTVVEDGKIVSTEEIKADKYGNAVIAKSFGEKTYVKLEETTENE